MEGWPEPSRFHVPFWIEISDSLVDYPRAMPDTTGLETHPFNDPGTGEYLGEVPYTYISVTDAPAWPAQKTNGDFVAFVSRTNDTLKRVSGKYPFIDLAAGFLVKAFLSDGLEQLFWHITAIEAVLGEKRPEGLTRLLKNRVGIIMGCNERECKDSAKLFGELYDFRSALVHGDERLTGNQANLGHVGRAREIARCVTLWMLRYLDHVLQSQTNCQASREDVLATLDLNPQTRPAFAQLLSALPPGFPWVPGWRD